MDGVAETAERKSWMPGSRPGMTSEQRLNRRTLLIVMAGLDPAIHFSGYDFRQRSAA